jgi:hypothetical protein
VRRIRLTAAGVLDEAIADTGEVRAICAIEGGNDCIAGRSAGDLIEIQPPTAIRTMQSNAGAVVLLCPSESGREILSLDETGVLIHRGRDGEGEDSGESDRGEVRTHGWFGDVDAMLYTVSSGTGSRRGFFAAQAESLHVRVHRPPSYALACARTIEASYGLHATQNRAQRLIVARCRDGAPSQSIEIFDLPTLNPTRSIDVGTPIEAVAADHAGDIVLIRDAEGASAWDIDTGRMVWRRALSGIADRLWIDTSRSLCGWMIGNTTYRVDLMSGGTGKDEVEACDFEAEKVSDGFSYQMNYGALVRVDAASKTKTELFYETARRITWFEPLPNGGLAVATEDGAVRITDRVGRIVGEFAGNHHELQPAIIGTLLASVGADSSIRLWDMARGRWSLNLPSVGDIVWWSVQQRQGLLALGLRNQPISVYRIERARSYAE